jgi:hypothetical protein
VICCLKTEVDYVLPADPEAPSCAHCHGKHLARPPAEAAGFGLLDHQSARDLVAAASRNPNTRWCLTALHPDGTAAAHGCAKGPRPWPPGPLQPGGPQPTEFLRALKLTLNIVIRGPCHHAQAEHGYRPGRALRHLIAAPEHPVHRARLRAARRPLRPGPHHPLAPRRPDLPL